MAEPESKRLKTEDAPYELIYWPGLPGRGELIRLLFVEAGVPFTDRSKDPGEAVGLVTGLMSDNGDDANPPAFAVPALRHGDLLISQTANILLYLAPKLGLGPSEGNGVYHLNSIALTLIDGFVNEIHETHHPIATSQYYADQKEEAKKRSKAYTSERIPRFLQYAQRVIDAKTSGDGPWLYGGKLTYVDLVLFQCIHGTKYAFPKAMEEMEKSGKYDGVFALFKAVQERPNIKEYMASDKRCSYGDGIWRYYPELEEE
ncbi:putative glutathione S-transferase family protein [Stachybotrys elegans]|uniref:Glutathione S-transferase family protein n=1 Tax=Stachybotrys elegans TaxID=80388 RepID=A0A8K0WLJ7_9HYPO|nr:putative glutathione S-transferase family protein [Stachybotrys elegans]